MPIAIAKRIFFSPFQMATLPNFRSTLLLENDRNAWGTCIQSTINSEEEGKVIKELEKGERA